MNILVCVKQVPGSNNVEVDPITGVLKRNGVQSKINPYDLYAIETALEIAEKFGGNVESITMGPPQAKAVKVILAVKSRVNIVNNIFLTFILSHPPYCILYGSYRIRK